MLNRASLLLLASLLFAGPAVSADPETAKAYEPEHLTTATSWKGRQFLQADAEGRLFLLRADSLEVYPYSAQGKLGDPQQLGSPFPVEIVRAAMSPDGDWIVTHEFIIRLFRNGQEEPVTGPKWYVTGVTFLGGDPVISGFYVGVQHGPIDQKDVPRETPVIQRWAGDSWEPLVSGALEEEAKKRPSWVYEQHSSRLLVTSDGRLWSALEYRPVLREYTAGGRLLTEAVIGNGEVTQVDGLREIEEADRKESRSMVSELGIKDAFVFTVTGRIVNRTMTEGPDGRIYVLTLGGSGIAGSETTLQRFDPVTQQLDQLTLRMPDQRPSLQRKSHPDRSRRGRRAALLRHLYARNKEGCGEVAGL